MSLNKQKINLLSKHPLPLRHTIINNFDYFLISSNHYNSNNRTCKCIRYHIYIDINLPIQKIEKLVYILNNNE